MYQLPLLQLLACGGGAVDDDPTDAPSNDSGTTDSGDTEEVVGDGTELVLLGYLGDGTVDAAAWAGREAMVAKAADSGIERCRFEWRATGEPHPDAASCDGCTFAHRVALTGGSVVGPSCDWLFEKNGPPPADGGFFP
ncbi:MAG: hypothetical protein EP330_26415 [Deltaproteobacteria bacterium]|nr:MAG: hypothetical protein EP330_26415 [Deltaproteobacteria bacterium]